MALTVVWTREAENQLDAILDYLTENWSERELKNFLAALENALKTIRSKPRQQKNSIRKKGAYEY
jgi:plasmid stabilization system protein ParE